MKKVFLFGFLVVGWCLLSLQPVLANVSERYCAQHPETTWCQAECQVADFYFQTCQCAPENNPVSWSNCEDPFQVWTHSCACAFPIQLDTFQNIPDEMDWVIWLLTDYCLAHAEDPICPENLVNVPEMVAVANAILNLCRQNPNLNFCQAFHNNGEDPNGEPPVGNQQGPCNVGVDGPHLVENCHGCEPEEVGVQFCTENRWSACENSCHQRNLCQPGDLRRAPRCDRQCNDVGDVGFHPCKTIVGDVREFDEADDACVCAPSQDECAPGETMIDLACICRPDEVGERDCAINREQNAFEWQDSCARCVPNPNNGACPWSKPSEQECQNGADCNCYTLALCEPNSPLSNECVRHAEGQIVLNENGCEICEAVSIPGGSQACYYQTSNPCL